MPDIYTLALFAVASLALTATPGPDMLLIATRSAGQGRAAGLATYFGIAAGTYCHALAAALGLSQLFLAVPVAYDVVRYIGAAYLLYLAWNAFRSDGSFKPQGENNARFSNGKMFRQGLFTNLLNPKMALFVLALFPQFLKPEAGYVATQILVLATVLNFVGFLVNGTVILMASRIGNALSKGRWFSRVPQIFLGTVFLGLAARLALDDKR